MADKDSESGEAGKLHRATPSAEMETNSTLKAALHGLNLLFQLVGHPNSLRDLDVFDCNLAEHNDGCECFWEQCEAWVKTYSQQVKAVNSYADLVADLEIRTAQRDTYAEALDKAGRELKRLQDERNQLAVKGAEYFAALEQIEKVAMQTASIWKACREIQDIARAALATHFERAARSLSDIETLRRGRDWLKIYKAMESYEGVAPMFCNAAQVIEDLVQALTLAHGQDTNTSASDGTTEQLPEKGSLQHDSKSES